jgi:hypothetical protein
LNVFGYYEIGIAVVLSYESGVRNTLRIGNSE